ncbi:unnamed protein product [Closterium sp. NIES-54]
MLPYLFPDLSSFTTADDLVSHLRATDSRFCAALSAEGAPPPLSPPPTPPQLLLTTTLVPRGSELLPLLVGSVAAAGAAGVAGAVGVAVEVAVVQAAGEVEVVGVFVGVEAVEVVVGAAEALGAVEGAAAAVGEEGAVVALVVRASSSRSSSRSSSSSSSISVSARPPLPSNFLTVHSFHTEQRCFARLSDAWRAKFPDAPEFPNWADLLRRDVPIFDLDYEAILAAMYALSVSAEGDCYLCVPPDPGIAPGIAPAALGACESAPLGTAPAQALHTFTLDSGASRCFFCDSTTITPLPAPVPVSLADPSGGPVLARSSTVLPCPTARLTGRHLATFARASGSSLYTLTTASRSAPLSPQLHASAQVATQCECRRLSHDTLLWHHHLGHPSLPRLRSMHSHLHPWPAACGDSHVLPDWSTPGHVRSCAGVQSVHPHHCDTLRPFVSLVARVCSGSYTVSLPPLPPSPAPPYIPCVEGRQRAAPHSSSFPPMTAPLQTLHMGVWGPARVSGQGRERYFLLVVDDYTRYITVFPLRSKGEVSDVLIPWIRTVRLQLRERFQSDFPFLRLHSGRGGEFSSALLVAFSVEHGIRPTFTLPASPQQNGVAECHIGLVMEVARTSMIHAAAPHFLWPFAVRYVAHQLNLWPRVSLPETSPTLLWTGKVGDASRFRWHDTLRTTLAALGFAPSTADPSLFLRTDTSLPPFYVLVYVNDLVFATADTEALALVKSELQKRHTCTDLGELRSYLGLQITRDRARRTITFTQSHMVQQVLQRFGFTWSSAQATPLATRYSLSAPPSDESVEPSGPYPELVGCLMYLMTCTRPDLAYPLGLLARYVAPGRHRKVHMDAAKRVLRYLCSTSGMGLVLGGRGDVVLTGHSDASWVDDQATQRSSQGYTFSLGSGSASWRSTRSSSVLGSSCEAEIYATAMAAQELRWLTYLLIDLGERPRSPPVLYVDNKATIALCEEHRLEHRTKHIALRYFLARELQERGQLHLTYVATRANTADIFTKALPPGDHQRFCNLLGLVPSLPHLQ